MAQPLRRRYLLQMGRFWPFFLALVVVGCAASQSQVAHAATPEQAVRHFEATVFGSDFDSGRDTLGKWLPRSRFRYWVTDLGGDYGAKSRSDVARIATELGALTGLAVEMTEDPKPATVMVAFTERRRFRTVLRATRVELPPGDNDAWLDDSACIAMPLGNPDTSEIDGAIIVVGTDIDPQKRRHCLVEELYQSLGPLGDTCIVRPSLICEADRVFELQPIDKLVLRTLYDPRLEPGMSREEAMPIAREIIRELWGE